MTLNSDSSGAGVTKQGGARLRLDPTAYRSITREQWLLRETRIVSALLVDEDATREEIVQRAQAENIFQYPTERMRSNIARVCLARLFQEFTNTCVEPSLALILAGKMCID